MLLVGLSSESNVRVMVPKLSQWQALPWDAKQIYVAFMSYFYCYGDSLDSFHTKIKSPSPKASESYNKGGQTLTVSLDLKSIFLTVKLCMFLTFRYLQCCLMVI